MKRTLVAGIVAALLGTSAPGCAGRQSATATTTTYAIVAGLVLVGLVINVASDHNPPAPPRPPAPPF
ncbi:MAG TPA: hypothetical protein VH165_07745 [Kofleriaceae bacterium]|jgi:uncharacterized membrane protein YdcZ (DUF606 family)|nr:hypothetical protein [Kofleriaceae bacterium]